jgi:hypothetical protein
VASNIKVSGKADYDNLMLSQFVDFSPGLEDLSLVASNIKASWNADDGSLMLSQFEGFPPGLEDLSLVASNVKVSERADDANSRIFHLALRTLALWPLILR